MIKNRFYPFNYKGINYCYDGDYGVTFASDENANNIIQRINDGESEIEILKNSNFSDVMNGILNFVKVNSIQKEEMASVVRLKSCDDEKMWREGKILNKMWLSIANSCNMRCSYCFENGGSHDYRGIMTKEKAKECIDFFFRYFNKNANTISVNFFGGEPLINKDVFIFATNYINSKIENLKCKPKYIITTNCTIMDDEILDVIIKNNMHVNISIDGRKDIHDSNRKMANGSGTFDIVVRNVGKILKDYDNITARITLTKSGVKTLKEDVQFLWNLGIPYIYISPVDSVGENLSLSLKDLEWVDEQLEELLDEMIQNALIGSKKVISNIEGYYENIDERIILKECKYYNPFTVMFSPDGDIYKCNRMLGNKEYKVGEVCEGIKWDLFKRSFKPESKCLDCWAKRLCGGGCTVLGNTEEQCTYKKIVLDKSLKFYSFVQSNIEKFKTGGQNEGYNIKD